MPADPAQVPAPTPDGETGETGETGATTATTAVPAPHVGHGHHHRPDANPVGRQLAVLTLTALGVVYGDIGTSPLYSI